MIGIVNRLPLYQHQITAVERLLMERYLLLYGDPGVGKTAAAARALRIAEPEKTAILAPLSTLVHWQRELWDWAQLPSRIVREARDVEASKILILNPEKLYIPPILQALRAQHFDALILDECQLFKNPTAKRTRYVYGRGTGLVHRADRVWALSGTPCPQGPVDLFVMLRVLFPNVLDGMSRDQFIERYHVLDVDKVRIVGVRRMDELAVKMGPHVLRQRIDECDLPPLRFGTFPLAKTDLVLDGDAYTKALQTANAEGWDALDDVKLMHLIAEERFHLSTVRALLAAAKAPAIAQMAADYLFDGTEKLVIFSWHLDAIAHLYRHLRAFGALMLTGSTPERARGININLFQCSPTNRVLIAQGDAGGLGITLTAAHEVWFVDCPWTPASLMQATKRLHRIGQKHSVLARIFTVAGTIDDAVLRIIMRKSRMISSLTPDATEGELVHAL